MSTLYNITNSTKLFMFIVGFTFIASAAIFCGEAARLYRGYLYRGHSAEYRRPLNDDVSKLKESYLEILRAPSAIACFAVYILALIISWL